MSVPEEERLKNLILLSNEVSGVKDLDVLMERVLESAREFLGCDAGSIYIRDGGMLRFSYTQNDTLAARLAAGQKLIYSTFAIPITNESIAGYVANTGEILNIPDAYALEEGLPFSFDASFDESADYRTRSMLTVPLKTSAEKVIGVLQLINRKNEAGTAVPFEPELEPYVLYFANNAASALERAQLMRDVLLRMISMTELHDPKETGNHVNRVGAVSVEIYETWARRRHIPRREIDRNRDTLRMAAMLHDVGKVAISDLILKKPARLTDEEYTVMKQHTILGARLFRNPCSDLDVAAREVALSHHERYDGTGYPGTIDPETGAPEMSPDGSSDAPRPKRGEEIPLFGRIVALADVFDALSFERCYKKSWDEEKVLGIIREERGHHFDPEIVDAFFDCLPSIRAIGARYS